MKTSFLSRGRALLLGMLAAVLLPAVAFAAGENYGRITGYVFDTSGNALAEIPVTVRGPAMQQPASAVTGKDGRFEFGTIPPGEGYELEVNTVGFKPVKQTNVVVRLGQATPVDFLLELAGDGDSVETIVIVGKGNPALNPDSAQTGAGMTSEKAVTTPIFTQAQAIPQMVAGVGPGNTPSSRGGLSRYGKQYVDGMETTDVSDGSISAPLNFFAIDQFEVITGGLDAQYNSLGMIENVVTKSGSNRFTYDVGVILSPSFANAKQQFAFRQPGYAGALLNNDSPMAQTNFYSPMVNFGGPIIKDRLWFYFSSQVNFSHKESPLSATENRPTDTLTKMGRLKLTWQPTDRDRLSLALNYDANTIDNVTASSSVALNAERRIDRGGYFVMANYDRTLAEDFLLQVQTGFTWKNSLTGAMPGADGISHTDNQARLTQFGPGSISGTEQGNVLQEGKGRFLFDPTVHYKLGAHQLKGGVQFSYLMGRNASSVTGNQRFFDYGGVCDPTDAATYGYCSTRVDFYNTDGQQAAQVNDASVTTYAAFAQDRWNVTKQLTLVGGLRFDMGRLNGDDGKYLGHLSGFGPRLSATYDLLGDRTTLLKAHYGRSNDVGDVFLAQQGNPSLVQVQSKWDSKAGAFPDCGGPGSTVAGCTTSGGLSGVQFLKGQRAPSVDEISLGLHRELVEGGLVVGVDGTYRRYNNLWVNEEVNRLWDPSGTKVLGYVDGQQHTIYQVHTSKSAYRDYRGLDLWLQGKAGQFDLLASYTLAFNNGTVGNYFDNYGVNPRMAFLFDGPTSDDIRHTLKGAINYNMPFGLDLGMRVRYQSGAPMWMNMSNPGANGETIYRSPRGTGYAFNSSSGLPEFTNGQSLVALRQPDQFLIDASARYDLGRAMQMKDNKMELLLQVFNVLNTDAAWRLNDSWSKGTSSSYGTVASRQSAMQAQLALRFRN